MTDFVRVSDGRFTPRRHYTVPRAYAERDEHLQILKSPALDQQGRPRPMREVVTRQSPQTPDTPAETGESPDSQEEA